MFFRDKLSSLDSFFDESQFDNLVIRAKLLKSRYSSFGFCEPHESAPTLPIPRRFGDYEILDQLGQGGMGRVYLARQVSVERLVALKVIRPEFLIDKMGDAHQFTSRFRFEAKTMAQLEHDHIVPVFEVGKFDDCLFYSMKLILGESFAEMLRRGPIEPLKAAKLIKQCADAVERAHQAGVLHRDIKPANILIDKDGRPYLSDFGLAKLADKSVDGLTQTGAVVGTVCFISPEQAQDASQVNETSDVYGLGAVLYMALTGRPPFQASNTYETIRQLVSDAPVSPRKVNPAIPSDLDSVCLKCLEKQPESRYLSSAELANDLERFLNSEPVLASPPSLFTKVWLWTVRNQTLASLMVTISVAGLILAVLLHRNSVNLLEASNEQKIEQIKSVDIALLPRHILDLRSRPGMRRESVHERFKNESSSDAQFRYALAICDQDLESQEYVLNFALDGRPSEVRMVLDKELVPIVDSERVWKVLKSPTELPEKRVRACCILANVDPDNEKWEGVSSELVPILLELDAVSATDWIQILAPSLPRFERLMVEASLTKNCPVAASVALAQLYSTQPKKLLECLGRSQIEHFSIFFEMIESKHSQTRSVLEEIVNNLSITDVESEIMCNVNLLIAATKLDIISLHEAFCMVDCPTTHILLVDRLGKLNCDVTKVIEMIDQREISVSHLKLAICSLCNYHSQNSQLRFKMQCNTPLERFLSHQDCGVRSAAKFILTKWGMGHLDEVQPEYDKNEGGGWYRTVEGQIMSIIRGESSRLPRLRQRTSHESPLIRRLPFKTYAISTCEVTKSEYQRFLSDTDFQSKFETPKPVYHHDDSFGPFERSPANFVSYDLAAAYCNWLSYREGVPEADWCYQFTEGRMRLRKDGLKKSGYRMPTEFEWDNATGDLHRLIEFDAAVSIFASVGDSDGKVTQTVGQLMPNKYGLFDMCGNVSEWTIRNDAFRADKQAFRGGSAVTKLQFIRDGVQSFSDTSYSIHSFGFRVVRTFKKGKFDGRYGL